MSIIGVDVDQDQLYLQKRRDFKWSFQNLDETGSPVNFPAGQLFFELVTGNEHNCVQQVTVSRANGGTYKLGLDGHWSPAIDYYDVTNAPHNMGMDISDAIEAITGVGAGNVEVRNTKLVPEWRIKLTLNEGANEVQRISFIGSPTGGTYRLTYGLGMTGNISVGAPPASVQSAIEGLAGIGAGQVSVTSDGGSGYLVEFTGSLANTDVLQMGAIARGIGFGLTGGPLGFGLSCGVKIETITRGSAKMGEKLVNTLNDTLNDFFDQFENLMGVDLDFSITDQKNVTFVCTSKRLFDENDLLTFSVDVTSNALTAFFNGVSSFLGAFNTINVDFRWNHTFEVEFINSLGLKPISTLQVDQTLLTGADDDERVEVVVLEPGKERLTKWPFTISGDTATLKIESSEVDKIVPRTKWQLVFLPAGEAAGGQAITRGSVVVQE